MPKVLILADTVAGGECVSKGDIVEISEVDRLTLTQMGKATADPKRIETAERCRAVALAARAERTGGD